MESAPSPIFAGEKPASSKRGRRVIDCNMPQHLPFIANTAQYLIYKYRGKQHHHAELEQHTNLIGSTVKTLEEYKFIKHKYAAYYPLYEGINKVEKECSPLCLLIFVRKPI
jgi:hypothetical protein